MPRKTEKQVVLETVDAPLRALGFTEVKVYENAGCYEYENPEKNAGIHFNRGRYGEYFRAFHFIHNYIFKLEYLNRGLTSDVYFKSNRRRDELREIMLVFLDATVNYVMPVLNRMSETKFRTTNEMYIALSEETHQKAKALSQEHCLTIECSEANMTKLSNIIEALRNNDYSNENIKRNIKTLINAAAYLGEVIISHCANAHWEWAEEEKRVFYVINCDGQQYCMLYCLVDHWLYTPEFEYYSLLNACKVILHQFRMDKGRFL